MLKTWNQPFALSHKPWKMWRVFNKIWTWKHCYLINMDHFFLSGISQIYLKYLLLSLVANLPRRYYNTVSMYPFLLFCLWASLSFSVARLCPFVPVFKFRLQSYFWFISVALQSPRESLSMESIFQIIVSTKTLNLIMIHGNVYKILSPQLK